MTHRTPRFSVSKRRVVNSVSAVVTLIAGSTLVIGITFGLFSASLIGETNSVTSGTVTLSNSAVSNCPISGLMPTGVAATPCTFSATYSGSTPAYLAADVVIETQAGVGGTPLYNPSDASNDLQVTLTSTTPSVTYTIPTLPTTCPAGAPAGSTCYELDNELIATTAFDPASTVGFSVSVALPTTSTTGYQGGSAQIIVTTHAVQSAHNLLTCTSTPTAGSPCVASGTFGWT